MSVDRAAGGGSRKPRAAHRVQSVERAVALLKATAAAPHPASVWELARTCGVNRSTAWRLLGDARGAGARRARPGHAALHDRLRGHPGRRRGRLRRAGAAGAAAAPAARRDGRRERDARRRPPLQPRLRRPGRPAGRRRARTGTAGRFPLHATSSGKVFLAWLPEEERDAVLRAAPRGATRRGRSPTAAGSTGRWARSGALGYGTCVGELEEFQNGVSAAVLDRLMRPMVIVNIWGPEPAGDAEAPARARADGAARRARGVAGAGVNWEAFITCAVTGAGDTTGRSPLVPGHAGGDRRRRDRGGPGRRGHRPHPRARPRDRAAAPATRRSTARSSSASAPPTSTSSST